MSSKISKNIEIKNRKASFEYHFIDTYTAGVVLKGTEIKSIRMGKVNISDAYCYFTNGELFIKNLNISPYDYGTHYNHDPLRERKLLLEKKELRKLEAKMKDVGLTIIPTRIYVNEKGLAKINIALAKGKKLYDKRESIKAKDIERQEKRQF
ncbi:SsrA-binding protein SmpB [Jiulongibacter sp. NS-SX5]|uniref:SsrA-binding protein SmpB n=1 Tax=Jiulongibacter sp. NS-SX5 TaxID=3463854 RepID=UPI0040595C99